MKGFSIENGRRVGPALAIVALLIVAGAAVGLGVATATSDDNPDEPPAAYYGDITIEDEPAPEETRIKAMIGGDIRGEIVTEQVGEYGGEGANEEKLQVNGSADDEGATVEFYALVDGGWVQADQTAVWESGDNRRVDLTVETPPGETSTPTPTPDDGGGDDTGGDDTGGDDTGGDTGSGGGGGGGGTVAPPTSPSIEIVSSDIDQTVVDVGGTVTARVTVENDGSDDGEFTAELSSNGETIADETVEVAEGETEVVTFELTFDEEGVFDLAVNDEDVDRVYVGVEPAEVVASANAELEDEASDEAGIQVTLDDTPIGAIVFSNENATGEVIVEELSKLPPWAAEPDGVVLEALQIDVPEAEEDNPATLEIAVDADDLDAADASADELTVVRYDEDAGEWESLETAVLAANGEVLLSAETPGFSLFAVTAPADDQAAETPTPTPDRETPTPEDDEEGVFGSMALVGIGIVGLIALLLAFAGARVYQQPHQD